MFVSRSRVSWMVWGVLGLALACSSPQATPVAPAARAEPAPVARSEHTCSGRGAHGSCGACSGHGEQATCAASGGTCGAGPDVEPKPETGQTGPEHGEAQGIELVRIDDPSTVCMMSNRYFGRPQVAATVDGKAYYGCCGGCAARLVANEAARAAQDPVTGRQVDKATAVLARDPRGRVHYFESEETLRRANAH